MDLAVEGKSSQPWQSVNEYGGTPTTNTTSNLRDTADKNKRPDGPEKAETGLNFDRQVFEPIATGKLWPAEGSETKIL